VPNYTPPSATYSDVPIASAAATTTTSQNLIAMGHLVQQQTTQGNAQKPRADQIDQAWKEYTAPNGMKYYHNAILKESTYTKPLTLTKREATSSTPKAREKRKWQEYADAASGKKYYSDGVSTTWEKPTGFDSDTVKPVRSIEETEQTKKKKKSASKNETSFSSKEEAIAAFKGLLLAKGIVPTIKWNEVAKICSLDSRWEACEDVLTVGERRQGLAEYQTKRANELKSLERQERIRAKDAFGQLLTDILPKISGFSARNSKFTDVRNSLAKDGRFHAVAAEETRARLFLDFCEEFRKRDERKKRNKKRETQDAFLSFLGEKEEAGTLTFASTW
jgi:pre-mRNA-processing factor 40